MKIKLNHFKTFLFTQWSYLQRLWAAHTSPILMTEGILKSQKQRDELTIKLHMSNQPQKSEINYSMNVVSYAQIAIKKHIIQARPANAHAES